MNHIFFLLQALVFMLASLLDSLRAGAKQ